MNATQNAIVDILTRANGRVDILTILHTIGGPVYMSPVSLMTLSQELSTLAASGRIVKARMFYGMA